jgi:hypothetical protein
LGSDNLGRDVCVNFIKTIFEILRNDVIDNINKFNLATVFVSIKCLYKKQDFVRTSNFFQITCLGISRTFQYFHTPESYRFFRYSFFCCLELASLLEGVDWYEMFFWSWQSSSVYLVLKLMSHLTEKSWIFK